MSWEKGPYEPHMAEGLTQMFVAGTSARKVGEVVQTLMEVVPSASTISRLNQTLTHQFETWRERGLQTHWRILYLDGVHFRIRHGDQTNASYLLHPSSDMAWMSRRDETVTSS